MSFFTAMNTSASGLSMQRLRMDVISQNIANATTTKTAEGTPYRRKTITVAEKQAGSGSKFSKILKDKIKNGKAAGEGVNVTEIVEDQAPFKKVYDPGNPEADEEGYVEMPNVNVIEEMVNMISASRSYEANVTAINASKAMAQKALEIGR